jgi:hypothetical protein
MTDSQMNRRKANRVNANLKLEINVPRNDGSQDTTTLETINISSSGIYFKSGHFIEPMTKLAMVLEVSVPGDSGSDESGLAPVPCEGLVVRIRPEVDTEGCDEYEVAVFFTHIESEGSDNLERHISLMIDDPA